MDISTQLFDIISGSIDFIFLGFCRCVSHCFRFIELFIFVVDSVLSLFGTILKYNNMVVECIIGLIHCIGSGVNNLWKSPEIIYSGFMYLLFGLPIKVLECFHVAACAVITKSKDLLYSGFLIIFDIPANAMDPIEQFLQFLFNASKVILCFIARVSHNIIIELSSCTVQLMENVASFVNNFIIIFGDVLSSIVKSIFSGFYNLAIPSKLIKWLHEMAYAVVTNQKDLLYSGFKDASEMPGKVLDSFYQLVEQLFNLSNGFLKYSFNVIFNIVFELAG